MRKSTKKKIGILGSTGSVGLSTLKVIKNHPDRFELVFLAARSNSSLLREQFLDYQPKKIALFDREAAEELKKNLPESDIRGGEDGILSLLVPGSVDLVVHAISGTAGLKPTLEAIQAGINLALANKESIVTGGEWLMALAREKGVSVIPIDSEHSALFQCLKGGKKDEVNKLILTSSGGPFFKKSHEELASVTLEQALVHPNYKMGPKITIDSSTMMNKGLEVIEARWLFDVVPKKIEVVVHPEQIVHSLVEFIDFSLLAQMGYPDMSLPIQYALSYPDRWNGQGVVKPFDFTSFVKLEFYPPDMDKFRCLKQAFFAVNEGKSYPCYLNKVNEVLVDRFLKKEISWQEIGEKLETLLNSHRPTKIDSFDTIVSIEDLALQEARII